MSVGEAILKAQQEGVEKKHIVYVEGLAASGAFVLKSNLKRESPKHVIHELEKLAEEDKKKKQVLYSHNTYKK
jgi:hypothetical protein